MFGNKVINLVLAILIRHLDPEVWNLGENIGLETKQMSYQCGGAK